MQDRPAAFHAGSQQPANATIVTRGDEPTEDTYSASQGRFALAVEALRELGGERLFVGVLVAESSAVRLAVRLLRSDRRDALGGHTRPPLKGLVFAGVLPL